MKLNITSVLIFSCYFFDAFSFPFAFTSEWVEADGFRLAPLADTKPNKVGFTSMPSDKTGVHFTNRVSNSLLNRNLILEVGSGVALGDVNGDNLVDIYACSIEGPNKLYLNKGDWKFIDISKEAGVECSGVFSTGAVLVDIDGDRDLDLLVNGIGAGTMAFLNNGSTRFTEVQKSGLDRNLGSTSMTLGDINGDGYLDLYVANYHIKTIKDSMEELDVSVSYKDGKILVSKPDLFSPMILRNGSVSLFELGQADCLYLNRGKGKFEKTLWNSGRFKDEKGINLERAPKGWSLSAMFRDMNQDGFPDLYVCNDFFYSPDFIWINNADGTFRASSALSIRQTSMSSMAVDFADIDRDGFDDIFIADMMSRSHERRHRQRGSLIHTKMKLPIETPSYRPEYPRNTMFLNRGDGTYSEIAQFSGIEASEWTWAIAFIDVDLDGYEDLLLTNGTLRNANDADLTQLKNPNSIARSNTRFGKLETPNIAYKNQGDRTFIETSQSWGFNFNGVSHGMALGDLDNDGDQDVVVNHMHQPLGLYRNNSPAPRISVKLRGIAPNTRGIGAKVIIRDSNMSFQSQEIISGGRYLSGDSATRTFAIKKNEIQQLEVLWPKGGITKIKPIKSNYIYEVFEGDGKGKDRKYNRVKNKINSTDDKIWFEDVSHKLKHQHHENPYDDFARQPALPRKLSTLGPGLSWYDADTDGWEDLIRSSGKGGHQVLYKNNKGTSFSPLRQKSVVQLDQTTLLLRKLNNGKITLLSTQSTYEDATSDAPPILQLNLQTGKTQIPILKRNISYGSITLGILHRKPALFAGGRVHPGRYPKPVSSTLFIENNGEWEIEKNTRLLFKEIGMVSDAIWSDLNLDGKSELILACDWGPIRIFTPTDDPEKPLREITKSLGFQEKKGWWNGIATGDFNSDGLLDIVATNLGKNSKYNRHLKHPIRLYYGDWNEDGIMDLFECYLDSARGAYVPFLTLDVLRQQLPNLAFKFSTFEEYSNATIENILADAYPVSNFLEVNQSESSVFLNKGDHFESHTLPDEAQMAPAFGIAVTDFDCDGNEDLFLSQNFFGVDLETSRYDAGRGLLLKGDGQGNFKAISGQTSGIILYGEQRGTAVCDFNHDGRPDLAVAQNSGKTGLFKNLNIKSGLRVILNGPDWNRDGIGAILRLQDDNNEGSAARIVSAGSGYWSQSSPVQILARKNTHSRIQILWPGGTKQTQRITNHQSEVQISYKEFK